MALVARSLLLVLLNAAWIGGCSTGDQRPAAGSSTSSRFRSDLDIRTLSNGLRMILVEDHSVPVVSYQSWFRVGSVDEHPGMTGSAHLFEHLMFKGTEKYPSKQFFEQLETRGAEVNAFTTRDYTAYYVNAIPSLLPKIVDMESDRLRSLTISKNDLERERQVVFQERHLRVESSPDGTMREALWQLAYRQHPYRWPVIGYPQDLIQLDVPQLQAFFSKYYHPGNLTIVVVGDFQAEEIARAIENHYGSIPSTDVPERSFKAESEQTSERRYTIEDHVASARFIQGYHVSRAEDPDTYPLDVLSNILFAGTTSRAYARIVEEQRLAAALSGGAFTPTFPGLFIIQSVMKVGVAPEAVETELSNVISEIQKSGVTQEEISTAVKQLTMQIFDGIRTPHGLAQLLGTVEMVLGDSRRYMDDIAKYEAVTPAQVQAVAQKYLFPNNRTTVILKPKKKGRKK